MSREELLLRKTEILEELNTLNTELNSIDAQLVDSPDPSPNREGNTLDRLRDLTRPQKMDNPYEFYAGGRK